MMAYQHRRVGAAVLAATLTAVSLTACSRDSDGPDDSSSRDQQSSQGADDTDGSGDADAPTANDASVPSDDALIGKEFTVAATYADAQITMRFDVVELERRGELLQLVAHLTNTETDQSEDLRWQVGGNTFASESNREDISSLSGFEGAVLIDMANKKRYLVAADSAGDCVCTGDLSGLFIDAGQTAELTATYAAPPESVAALDVRVPSIGLFRDVPIS